MTRHSLTSFVSKKLTLNALLKAAGKC